MADYKLWNALKDAKDVYKRQEINGLLPVVDACRSFFAYGIFSVGKKRGILNPKYSSLRF